MGFCPKCKYEYQPGVNVCPDCNEQLVSHLPVTTPSAAVQPDDSWVGVCRVAGGTRTGLAKGALDSNNIPSIVMSSQFTAMGGAKGLQAALGSAQGDILMVPREYVEEAELILEAILGEDFDRLDAPM
jgi:hypothetical protein